MLAVNSSVIIQIINFLVLLIILNFVLYRPIRKILNHRNEEISSTRRMTEEWDLKAGSYSTEFQENVNRTRKEGINEKEILKQEGLEEEKRILQETHIALEEKINRSRLEIQGKLEQARIALQGEVDGFSKELTEKLLGRGI